MQALISISGILAGVLVGTVAARRISWRPSRTLSYSVVGLAALGIVSADVLVLFLRADNAHRHGAAPLVLLFIWTLALASVGRFAAYDLRPAPPPD